MQCVILAAGKGIRMGPLTKETPKALLTVAGKTLLEYKLDALPRDVDEVIIVIGYMGNVIEEKLGAEYNGKRLLYVLQQEQRGTADALWSARSLLRDTFLVMYADDMYAKEDIVAAIQSKPWSVVAIKVNSLGSAAKIVTNKRGRVLEVLESGDRDNGAGLLNTCLYHLDTRVFNYRMVPKAEGSREFGLPQTLVKSGESLYVIPGTFFLQITSPEDLEKAEKELGK